jgi:integrase
VGIEAFVSERQAHNFSRGKLSSTKNRQRRSVDLSLQTTEALRQLLLHKKAECPKAGRRLSTWVFTTAEGGPFDGDHLRRRVFAKILTAANLRAIGLHDLRHSYATPT